MDNSEPQIQLGNVILDFEKEGVLEKTHLRRTQGVMAASQVRRTAQQLTHSLKINSGLNINFKITCSFH